MIYRSILKLVSLKLASHILEKRDDYAVTKLAIYSWIEGLYICNKDEMETHCW